MGTQLSKDADKLLCILYKKYLDKRKENVPKNDAKLCGGSNLIRDTLVPNWSLSDVDNTCWELSRAGMLKVNGSNHSIYLVWLSDSGIVYMENRFKNGVKEVTEFLTSFIP